MTDHDDAPTPYETLAFRVWGTVQGVNFRAATRELAMRLGLDGWVRNVADGTVQGRVGGPADAVDAFLDALPTAVAAAEVRQIESFRRPLDVPLGFQIRPTMQPPTEDFPAPTPAEGAVTRR